MFSFNKDKKTSKNISKNESNSASEEKSGGWLSRLKSGLSKTRANLTESLTRLVAGEKSIDDDLLEEIETQLLMADIGVDATNKVITELTDKLSRKQLTDAHTVIESLRNSLATILEPCAQSLTLTDEQPYVILVVGVNGVGKTTTIGKVAHYYQQQGKSVMLAAGDTFRAAATEQLQAWGERNNVPVVAQQAGSDSASVIYDAIESARAKKTDILIADTAGRLHTQSNLMEELKKVKRVIGKLDESAPHEVLLVLDAGTGQNALSQATEFSKAVDVSGIALTKLDGTAKGGIIFSIANKLDIPVRFIGVGEGINDLREFHVAEFIDALFDSLE